MVENQSLRARFANRAILLLCASLCLDLHYGRADDGIAVPKLEALKAATVYIKVKLSRGEATGSGFVVLARGNDTYVVTNEHVVTEELGRRARNVVSQIRVVFHAGTQREQTVTAQLIGRDSEHDLALLVIPGVLGLPDPIKLQPRPALHETMQVYGLGFPFGGALATGAGNPALTVSKLSVSSLRKNKEGELDAVQLDGSLNHGNSGGPVVDPDGRLVGVVRAGIPGSGISMAIPAATVEGMLAGRLGQVHLTPHKIEKAMADLQVRVQLLDPFRHIKALTVHYRQAQGAEKIPEGEPDNVWKPIQDARNQDLVIEDATAAGTIFIARRSGGSLKLLVQFSILNDRQERSYTRPRVIAVELETVSAKGGASRPRGSAGAGIVPLPPLAIKAPEFEGNQTVRMLPALIQDVAIGGGGRYVIMHLPKLRKLAVFDVSLAKVAHYIPLTEDNVKFTAGMDKLMVGLPSSGAVERWSLTTFEREAVGQPSVRVNMEQFLMGSASQGPLFIGGTFFDILTLEPSPFQELNKPVLPGDRPTHARMPGDSSLSIRASASGRVFGFCQPAMSGLYITYYVLGDTDFVQDPRKQSQGNIVPSSDGAALFSASGVFFTRAPKAWIPAEGARGCLYIPAVENNYALAFSGPKYQRASVCVIGDAIPIATFPELSVSNAGTRSQPGSDFTRDKRIYFVPSAKVLVMIPDSNDRIVLERVDIEKALAESAIDYLFIDSPLPPAAVRGTDYAYQLKSRSRKGGVKYGLAEGPLAMSVSEEGNLGWKVPIDFPDDEITFTIALRDKSGQEHLHIFPLSIVDPKEK